MSVTYVIASYWYNSSTLMIPGLTLGKLYSNSILVLLNNRFTIIGGRNAPHPDFDIVSYRRSGVTGTNMGSVASHDIAFAHSHPAEATSMSGDLGRVSKEFGEMPGKMTATQ